MRDFYKLDFCSPNLLNETSDTQFSTHGPSQDGTTLGKPSEPYGILQILLKAFPLQT